MYILLQIEHENVENSEFAVQWNILHIKYNIMLLCLIFYTGVRNFILFLCETRIAYEINKRKESL